MKATETKLIQFLQGTNQFIIPIYQRTYSWTEKQCKQLWDDIIRAANNDDIQVHFIGSVVYIEKGIYQVSSVPQLLLIDGQQRLTTITLLLAALRNRLEESGDGKEITKKKIENYYLFNNEESGENRYKLVLTQSDKNSLINIIENREQAENSSPNIVNNYHFFQNKIKQSEIDPDLLYKAISKLILVNISLNSTYDNPQLIFESLNSTGLALSQADLIRNFVLMGLEPKIQNEIYQNHWYEMEKSFGHSQGSTYFDRFMRDYLTIKTGQIPNKSEVYASFKEYFMSKHISVEDLVSDIHYFAKFFTKMVFGNIEDEQINQIIKDINALKVDVAYPFLLEVYADYTSKKINREELCEILSLVENYVFRRDIVAIPTNSLNKTFANLASEIDKDKYLESFKAILILKESYRRFPKNKEFHESLLVRNIYRSGIRKYFFDKLENFERKERVDTENYTIEHIMPQNKNLSEEWRKELGEKWADIHEKYLHTIGNLTLTGYNPELSDKSFLEKRNIVGGFKDSPLRLNSSLAQLEHWNESEIVKRANELADKAEKIWVQPELPDEVLAKYTAEEENEEFDEDDEYIEPEWDERLTKSSREVQQVIERLLSNINQKFTNIAKPYYKWLFLYTTEPTERKTCFAILTCGKNTANVIFRINPKTFTETDQNIRTVAGWFFSRGTERRISLKEDLIPRIMHYLEHSYSTTNNLSEN